MNMKVVNNETFSIDQMVYVYMQDRKAKIFNVMLFP